MRLIIGPTSAGKSSYIQGLTDEGAAKPKVYFAHQVQKSGNIPTGDNVVVHYNLLHGVKGRREAVRLGESELLHNLIDAARRRGGAERPAVGAAGAQRQPGAGRA